MPPEVCGNCEFWIRVNVPEQLMGTCSKYERRKHRDGVCINKRAAKNEY